MEEAGVSTEKVLTIEEIDEMASEAVREEKMQEDDSPIRVF